ncbi:hypothetical protein SELMODRAFT_427287 [Selaginella moellendorffii]|uniref:GDP-D-glucose phosphorylase 1 n=1 Tax=Selaginella moellendorffii TaxID=88036 RepID=D8SZ43_SELML|nr:GDP-L-galactose phosphorylase 1 [Selaginella moellendorffii]EFJ10427.1 hypothetical protein SELMODRAFT_427287 [Selaginella moellendorffii]|eukprot:XP_002988631.1 GDP-L-galactose phosphorylase 1 [Selaginella moellendorffii]
MGFEAAIVSNDRSETNHGCGRNCLGPCCFPGARVPLYLYGEAQCMDTKGETIDFLHSFILAPWMEKQKLGLFRYDVTSCETKILSGDCGFIAQLNEGRHSKKRPTEFKMDQVLQDFDPSKFNFTKVGQEEILFSFDPENSSLATSSNMVIINVSPIEFGHILLIPRLLDCLPQRLEVNTFIIALQMAKQANNIYFRLGFNSLGAFATINHLHFQAYYLEYIFPVEKASKKLLVNHVKGFNIYKLENYPVKGIIYELGSSNFQELSYQIVTICNTLEEQNIPYNVLIADKGSQIYLFPQCFAERQVRGEVEAEILETQVNPAVWEISGHIVLKRKQDFENVTQEYAWKLLAEVSLNDKAFNKIINLVTNDKYYSKM